MEKRFLYARAFPELNVVDDEYVYVAVAVAEPCLGIPAAVFGKHAVDVFVQKSFACRIKHFQRRLFFGDFVCDRLQ